ncbi:MAG: hypothetical protein ABIB93_07455 [Chloroflexota bacterium]
MQEGADLGKIQKTIYLSYFQDGLWDILLGLFLLAWGVSIMADFVAFLAGSYVIGYAVVFALKRRITYPRIGYVQSSGGRKQKLRLVIAGFVALLLGTMILAMFFISSAPQWLHHYFVFLFGTMLAIVISLIAYWWGIRRWYIYALLIWTGVVFHQWLDAPLGYSFIVPGAMVMLFGIVLLLRFLRKYPKPTKEG